MQGFNPDTNNGCGCTPILFIVIVLGVGYLLCSLISLSFNYNEWNTVSHVVKWIAIVIAGFAFSDMFNHD